MKDLHVDVAHSNRLQKALRRAKKQVEFVEYEGIEHYFRRNEDRIDMLEKMGRFLENHLAPLDETARVVSTRD